MTTIADIRARLRKDLHASPFVLSLSKGANCRCFLSPDFRFPISDFY